MRSLLFITSLFSRHRFDSHFTKFTTRASMTCCFHRLSAAQFQGGVKTGLSAHLFAASSKCPYIQLMKRIGCLPSLSWTTALVAATASSICGLSTLWWTAGTGTSAHWCCVTWLVQRGHRNLAVKGHYFTKVAASTTPCWCSTAASRAYVTSVAHTRRSICPSKRASSHRYNYTVMDLRCNLDFILCHFNEASLHINFVIFILWACSTVLLQLIFQSIKY